MTRSHDLFLQAQRHIPGGVNSPVRAFRGVGGDPLFFKRGEGAYLYDEDDRQYIDYVGSWGPMILGPCASGGDRRGEGARSTTASASARRPRIETEMAEKVCALVPSIEMVRMVSSGTEATMSAIRLARGFTGRDKIVKFEGCYHGHADSLLVKAGSGALTLGVPTSRRRAGGARRTHHHPRLQRPRPGARHLRASRRPESPASSSSRWRAT